MFVDFDVASFSSFVKSEKVFKCVEMVGLSAGDLSFCRVRMLALVKCLLSLSEIL